MAITSRKITTYADNMKDVPVIPDISGEALLAKMDSRTDNEVKTLHNGLIDDLLSTTSGNSGADNIGSATIAGVTGTTIWAQVSNVKTQLDNAILGEFSPGGIGTSMIADGAITTAKLATDVSETISELNSGVSELNGSVSELNGSVSELNNLFLTADKTIYVATTGNDTTGDGSSGNPYATWGKALSVIPKNTNYYFVKISIAPGTYNETVYFNNFYNGSTNVGTSSACDIEILLSGTTYVTKIFVDNTRVHINNGGVLISTTSSGGYFINVLNNGLFIAEQQISVGTGSGLSGAFIDFGGRAFFKNALSKTDSSTTGVIGVKCGAGSYCFISTVNINLTGAASSIGLMSSGGMIKVSSASTLTAATRLSKSDGGEIKTGAGVDLT